MGKELAVVTKKELTAYVNQACQKFGIAPQGLAPAEIEAFGIICDTMNLSPLKREVYAIPYTDKKKGITTLQIVVGYEVYLKRAVRSGKLKGYKVRTEGSLKGAKISKWGKMIDVKRGDFKAIITINVAGWDAPFEWEVAWDEYTQDNSMWNSKPSTMLKKVAMAQGFRLAFPDEIDGLPYTSDEMPDRQPVTEMVNHNPAGPIKVNEAKPAKKKKPAATPTKAAVQTPEYTEETVAPEVVVDVQAEPKPEDAPIPVEAEEVIEPKTIEQELEVALMQAVGSATTEANLAEKCGAFGKENSVKINSTPALKEIYLVAVHFIKNPDEADCFMSGKCYSRTIGKLDLSVAVA